MKISYAITVCNELVEIQKLLPYLQNLIRSEDEIVILYDKKNGDKKVEEYLRGNSVNNKNFNWVGKNFKGHFADWKNQLTKLCKGDYIFQIDADEIPNEILIHNLPTILETNSSVDVYHVPRVNTVKGLTDEHIQKWRWRVDEKGWVNWPDYQTRIYKNHPNIKWDGKVHEKIKGFNTWASLDPEERWCLYHPKTIERQEKQNNYYNTL